jgi:hypothetical protein
VILALLVAFARAEDPPPDEPFRVDEEVIVYDLEVEQARHQLLNALRDEGFTIEKQKDGYTVLRHELSYHGEVRVYDDGWILVKRQPVRAVAPKLPFAEQNSPLAWAGCVLYAPFCVRAGGQLVSGRKFRGYEAEIAFAVDPEVRALADRIATSATEVRLNDLPGLMTALWERGEPFDGGPPIEGWEERRRALWAFWDGRTDTEWGETIRQAVEAFVRAEVQKSPHPFTADELARLEAARTGPRPFEVPPP